MGVARENWRKKIEERGKKVPEGIERILGVTFPAYAFLGMFTLAVCWLFVWRLGVFGVKVDWLSQHSVIPEYFRQQFYDTGDLFPEFAANLGGGQNAYNFSYYGLYSPVILISYLLPFVKMGDYLMAASVAEIALSACLIYYWLERRKVSGEIRIFTAMMYVLAGPVVFHSCHQLMFINYMPFLCMAFLGIDRYFEKNRPGLYTASVFLMIMTSFYYSIGGMMALTLYGLSRYLERREKIAGGILFLLPMVTAVLMSGILLVPTACAILGKRERSGKGSLWKLLLPKLPLEGLVHGAYGAGLTTLVITVLLTGLFPRSVSSYRKSEKALHLGCLLILTIPLFPWILNGGLYVRGKVFIPFLPLFCYMTALYLEKQKERCISSRVSAAAYTLTACWVCISHFGGDELCGKPLQWYLIFTESVLFSGCFLIYWRWNKLWALMLPAILCLLISGSFLYGAKGEALDQDTYGRITDRDTGKLIGRVLKQEQGFYRLEQGGSVEEKSADLNRIWDSRQWISSVYSSAYHAGYQEFREKVFETEEPFRNGLMQSVSDNPLFQKLMGVRYIVKEAGYKDDMAAAGYEPYMTEAGLTVYKSETAAPVAYATDRIIKGQDYDELEFPYNQTVLMRYAVAGNGRNSGNIQETMASGSVHSSEIRIPEMRTKEFVIRTAGDGSIHVQSEKNVKLSCEITDCEGVKAYESTEVHFPVAAGGKEAEKYQGRLLFVQFHVKNLRPGKDVEIWLNETRNKLSARNHIYYNGNTVFTYVTALRAGQQKVELTFGKGSYKISGVKCFLGDTELLKDEKTLGSTLYQSVFVPDWEQTKGNRIQGEIQVERTGYFITSVPYDTGFEINVDGKQTIPEKVNRAFLGFPICKGRHQVEIIYHAPGMRVGRLCSGAGIVLLVVMILYGHRRRSA